MNRLRAPPLLAFAVASVTMHAAAFVALRRVGSAHAPSLHATAETVCGDTFEVEPSPVASSEPEAAGPPDEPRAREEQIAGEAAAARAPGRKAASLADGATNRKGVQRVFGAVGERFATDLATTVTRALPQAASADPLWGRAPFGSAGEARLTLVLDADGRIIDSSILGAPSSALRRGLERTIALLAPRQFTAHGPITRIRVSARVSPDDVHDGLHGDVFALSGGSFSGDVGSAFFALPAREESAARRVDLELRLLP